MQSETKEKLKLKKNLYRITLISFVVVMVWIGFEIYFSYTKKPQEETRSINLKPVIPNLHTELAQELLRRESIDPTVLESFANSLPTEFPSTVVASQPSFPVPITTPTPSSTQSAQPIVNQ